MIAIGRVCLEQMLFPRAAQDDQAKRLVGANRKDLAGRIALIEERRPGGVARAELVTRPKPAFAICPAIGM
jgi:hypothetical protein